MTLLQVTKVSKQNHQSIKLLKEHSLPTNLRSLSKSIDVAELTTDLLGPYMFLLLLHAPLHIQAERDHRLRKVDQKIHAELWRDFFSSRLS